MLKTILLPVDGSESSQRAMSFAAELASELQASISLVNVLDTLPSRKQLKNYLFFLERNPNSSEAEIKDVRNALSRSGEDQSRETLSDAEHFLKGKGVKDVSTSVRDGDPATIILRLAETGKYGLIIMGRRGRGLLEGLFMGSVSQKVSKLADCPVVTVK